MKTLTLVLFILLISPVVAISQTIGQVERDGTFYGYNYDTHQNTWGQVERDGTFYSFSTPPHKSNHDLFRELNEIDRYYDTSPNKNRSNQKSDFWDD